MEPSFTASSRPRGVSVVIAYKAIKAAAQLLLAGMLASGALFGVAGDLEGFASRLREHFTGAWSQELVRLLLSATSHLGFVAAALGLDGALSSVEAWALHRGFRWAPWLVVVTTSCLLPFEVVELVRAVSPARAAAFVVNVAVVVYLGRRARGHAELTPRGRAR